MEDEQFNFGSTLDNGQSTHDLNASETHRTINKNKGKKAATKKENKQNKQTNDKQREKYKDQESTMISSSDYQLSRARRPAVCIATVFFKGSAFFIYFFLGYLMSHVLTFIFTVILGALDFWVVKNVSGRLLVGLRWWSDYDEKGNQIWKYQTHTQDFQPNAVDRSFFWTSQIIGTLVWGLLFILNMLQLDMLWALLMGINFGFCATNLYGYYMCHGEHKKKISKLKQKFGKAGLLQIAGRFI